jgi:hypothetical protein
VLAVVCLLLIYEVRAPRLAAYALFAPSCPSRGPVRSGCPVRVAAHLHPPLRLRAREGVSRKSVAPLWVLRAHPAWGS